MALVGRLLTLCKTNNLGMPLEKLVCETLVGNTGSRVALSRPIQAPVRKLSTKSEIDENVKQFEKGNFDKALSDPQALKHFRNKPLKVDVSINRDYQGDSVQAVPPLGNEQPSSPTYTLPHPIWSKDEVNSIEITHYDPQSKADRLAHASVKLLRGGFDFFSGFSVGKRTEKKWLRRIIFLETVAGVPGMMAAMVRHLKSLRRMERDYGWIHTLLEEAENERMHLMTALQVRQPGPIFRGCVLVSQGIFVNGFFLAYLINPKFCHRFVGYLEEEAVKTYTKCIQDIDTGVLESWKTQPAPPIAMKYWQLEENSTMRDVILAIRADEAHHRVVNHTFASLKETHKNPYGPGR